MNQEILTLAIKKITPNCKNELHHVKICIKMYNFRQLVITKEIILHLGRYHDIFGLVLGWF